MVWLIFLSLVFLFSLCKEINLVMKYNKWLKEHQSRGLYTDSIGFHFAISFEFIKNYINKSYIFALTALVVVNLIVAFLSDFLLEFNLIILVLWCGIGVVAFGLYFRKSVEKEFFDDYIADKKNL